MLHTVTVLTDKGVEFFKTAGAPLMGSKQAGSSAVIGPDGRVLKAPGSPDEQLIVTDLDLSLITKTRLFADAGGHCKLQVGMLYSGLTDSQQIAALICFGWEQILQ